MAYFRNTFVFSRVKATGTYNNIAMQLLTIYGLYFMTQGWPDLNQAIKVTKSDFINFFDFFDF